MHVTGSGCNSSLCQVASPLEFIHACIYTWWPLMILSSQNTKLACWLVPLFLYQEPSGSKSLNAIYLSWKLQLIWKLHKHKNRLYNWNPTYMSVYCVCMLVCDVYMYIQCVMYAVYTQLSVWEQTLFPSYPQRGETALHWASCAGQTVVVKVLLDHGADVHAVDKWVGGVLCDALIVHWSSEWHNINEETLGV